MLVGVFVIVGVAVAVRVDVLVGVTVAVLVAVRVGVLVGVLVTVGVFVAVGVAVRVGVCVAVNCGDGVAVLVRVAVGVTVGVRVAVEVGVFVGVFVGVGVGSDTVHPLTLVGVYGMPFVSVSVVMLTPRFAEPVVPTTVKLIFMTLTVPVGIVKLDDWVPETGVVPDVNVPEFVVGGPLNSVVLPPTMDTMLTIVWSYVIWKVYAPSGAAPTATVTSL